MPTQDNLQAAFAGESQASRKYTYFAEKADAEGQPQVARLFRAAAEAEGESDTIGRARAARLPLPETFPLAHRIQNRYACRECVRPAIAHLRPAQGR